MRIVAFRSKGNARCECDVAAIEGRNNPRQNKARIIEKVKRTIWKRISYSSVVFQKSKPRCFKGY